MRRRKLSVGMLDVFLNLTVSMIVLFFIALLLINPGKKNEDGIITPIAEFMIILEWDHESPDDLDLWVRDGQGRIVSFRAKQVGIMHLDRDDLGFHSDRYIVENGEERTVKFNQEIVTLRAIEPGRYTVNVHYYRGSRVNRTNVKLVKLNPYKEFPAVFHDMGEKRGEKTFMSFNIGEDGEVYDMEYHQEPFIRGGPYVP